MAHKSVHCFFSGVVQGIGFRYTTRDIARRLGVKGWVKNLPDGRVELYADAEEKTLSALLGAITQSSLGGYIKDAHVQWGEPDASLTDFTITF